jgi:23S rRNA pseudouridine2605 synthase
MAQERLQKLLARAGLGSRRACELLITAGRVRVAGRLVTELGVTADPSHDAIEVDGRRLSAEPLTYVVLHKPRGVVATLHDPEGRPTVADLVRGAGVRLFPVGRLDFATSGVLLLTNDGEFSDALLRPARKVPKTYVVKLDHEVADRTLEAWRNGIELEDGVTLPTDAHLLRTDERGHSWLRVTLHEGRNQQIRRMAEATGLHVNRLARLAFAGIDCEGLRPGQWRLLTVDELRTMNRDFGVPRRVRPQGRPTPEAPTPVPTGRQKPLRARAPAVTSGRTSRSGTTPRAAAGPDARAPAAGRRPASPKRRAPRRAP